MSAEAEFFQIAPPQEVVDANGSITKWHVGCLSEEGQTVLLGSVVTSGVTEELTAVQPFTQQTYSAAAIRVSAIAMKETVHSEDISLYAVKTRTAYPTYSWRQEVQRRSPKDVIGAVDIAENYAADVLLLHFGIVPVRRSRRAKVADFVRQLF